jgi:transcriptional/translational regulatory protein YebC/TACO1
MFFPKTYTEEALLEAALEAGADDLADAGETWKLTCGPSELLEVKEVLEAAGFTPESAEPSLEPTQLVPVTDEAEAKKVLRLLDAIDDLDDVQAVHANFDVADEILAAYEG